MKDHLQSINFESKTALSNIHLSLDLLESEDHNPDHRSYFQIIRNNLTRLKALVPSGSKTLAENKQDQ